MELASLHLQLMKDFSSRTRPSHKPSNQRVNSHQSPLSVPVMNQLLPRLLTSSATMMCASRLMPAKEAKTAIANHQATSRRPTLRMASKRNHLAIHSSMREVHSTKGLRLVRSEAITTLVQVGGIRDLELTRRGKMALAILMTSLMLPLKKSMEMTISSE